MPHTYLIKIPEKNWFHIILTLVILSLVRQSIATTIKRLFPRQSQSNQFVTWDGKQFRLNNSNFYACGPNVYWLGFTEVFTYPPKVQVDEMFAVAAEMQSTVVRSHTLGISSGSPKTLRPFDNKLNDAAWEPIDYAISVASKYNIKLIIPLTDAYGYYHGNYGDFCVSRGVPKADFFNNTLVRQDFKQYITDWLNHVNVYTRIALKDDPTIFLIELGNELGNIRPEFNSFFTPPRDWLVDISQHIKSIDRNHLILNPADESLGLSQEFTISTIEVYSEHFYANEFFRMDKGSLSATVNNKSYIVGEYDPRLGPVFFSAIESRPNIKGSIFWHLYPHEFGLNGGAKVLHTDGYTLWYPEDKDLLIQITNHFRRLRNLPAVSDLTVVNTNPIPIPFQFNPSLLLLLIPFFIVVGVIMVLLKKYGYIKSYSPFAKFDAVSDNAAQRLAKVSTLKSDHSMHELPVVIGFDERERKLHNKEKSASPINSIPDSALNDGGNSGDEWMNERIETLLKEKKKS